MLGELSRRWEEAPCLLSPWDARKWGGDLWGKPRWPLHTNVGPVAAILNGWGPHLSREMPLKCQRVWKSGCRVWIRLSESQAPQPWPLRSAATEVSAAQAGSSAIGLL